MWPSMGGIATHRGVVDAASLGSTGLRRGIKRVNILGVGVSAIDMSQALEIVEGWLARRSRATSASRGCTGSWRASGMRLSGGFTIGWARDS